MINKEEGFMGYIFGYFLCTSIWLIDLSMSMGFFENKIEFLEYLEPVTSWEHTHLLIDSIMTGIDTSEM